MYMAVNSRVDIKQNDITGKGVVQLPHGTGINMQIAVFAQELKANQAKDAWAEYCGTDYLS